MSYSQITKHLGLFFILLSTLLLLSCGGSPKKQKYSSSNYRLISIDIDEDSNDSIDYKLVYKYDNNDYNFKIEKTNFSNTSLSTITTKTFDSKGNVLTKSETYKNLTPDNKQSAMLRLWAFTYNKSGQLSSKKFQDFKQNIFEYWIENNNIRTSYSATGMVISTTQFTTDKYGNKLTELIDINNNGKADKKVISTYNNDGKLLTSITTDLNSATKEILKKQTRHYDKRGNIVSIITIHPSTHTKQLIKYQYSYDIYGNILTSTITSDSAKTEKRLYVWEEIAPPVSFVGPITWAGTGCKAGHVSISGKNTDSLSILFDAYDAGKDSRSNLKRSACSISIAINVLPGYQISQLTTDWEGYTEGQGELKRKYFLTGQPYTSWIKNIYNNPEGDNFSQRDDIYNKAFATGCRGKEYIVRIDSQIKTIDPSSYMAIDSTDLYGNVQFFVRSKRCP